jgi:hypothetical protein
MPNARRGHVHAMKTEKAAEGPPGGSDRRGLACREDGGHSNPSCLRWLMSRRLLEPMTSATKAEYSLPARAIIGAPGGSGLELPVSGTMGMLVPPDACRVGGTYPRSPFRRTGILCMWWCTSRQPAPLLRKISSARSCRSQKILPRYFHSHQSEPYRTMK